MNSRSSQLRGENSSDVFNLQLRLRKVEKHRTESEEGGTGAGGLKLKGYNVTYLQC